MSDRITKSHRRVLGELSHGSVVCEYRHVRANRQYVVNERNEWCRMEPGLLNTLIVKGWIKMIGARDTPTRLYVLSERGWRVVLGRKNHDN